jgi:hypothetical protein
VTGTPGRPILAILPLAPISHRFRHVQLQPSFDAVPLRALLQPLHDLANRRLTAVQSPEIQRDVVEQVREQIYSPVAAFVAIHSHLYQRIE